MIFFISYEVFGKQISFIPDLIFYPTWKTRHLKEFKNLNGIWRSPSDEMYRVPFVEDEKKQLTLRKEFFLKQKPVDSLYLYFEGISWESEIYLNGKLLTIYNQPFQDLLIAIPPELFNIQWNWIEVHLKVYPHQTDEWWTIPFLGIYKSVFLLQKDNKIKPFIQSAYSKVDSVLIYFPFSINYKYNISEKELVKDLELMKAMKVKGIYIPYYVTPKIKKLINKYNIYLVDNYEDAKYVAIYRSHSETNVYPFWFKSDLQKTNFYGNYTAIRNTELFKTVSEISKPLMVFWGILVLVLLMVYRFTNYENYKNLWLLFPSIRQMQAITNDFHLINAISLKYFFVVRVIVKALIISLFIHQLHLTDNIKLLNFWHKNNLIYSFSKEYGESFLWSFVWVSIFLSVFNGLKIMIWQFVEWVYHLRDYRNKNMIIEIYGEMPFLLYAYWGLMALMLVGGYGWLWIFVLSIVLTITKKQYYLITQYNLNYKIPFSVIFFYLCGFELLPWLLLI